MITNNSYYRCNPLLQVTCNKRSLVFGSKVLFFFSIPLLLICISCERGATEIGEDTVSWPEITRFDDIAFRADGYVRVKDYSAVRELYGDLLEAGKAVKMSTVPSQIANIQEVEVLLGDLTNMIDGLEADGLDDATLGNLVLGLHPVIAKLIEASGMPHIHANEGPNSGFLFPIFDSDGKQSGTVEIKLHDDAGDLEVWLKYGGHGGEAWRLPLNTT